MKLGIANAPACSPVPRASSFADDVTVIDETATAVAMVLAMLRPARPAPPPLPHTPAGVLRALDARHGAA